MKTCDNNTEDDIDEPQDPGFVDRQLVFEVART